MFSNLNLRSYQHFISGRDALSKAPFGLTKDGVVMTAIIIPAILSFIMGLMLLTDEPLIVQILEPYFIKNVEVNVGIFLITVAVIICLSLWYLRVRSKRSLVIKHLLHQTALKMRSHFSELCKTEVNTRTFTAYSKEILAYTEYYFNELISRGDIKIAVRVFLTKNGQQGYYTAARSSKFDARRKAASQFVPIDKGEAKLLQEKAFTGVIVYQDIDTAEADEVLYKTKNRKLFRREVENIAVAPIVGWDGEDNSMIGMLYVVSDKRKTFSEKHTDSILFIADILASLYIGILNKEQTSTRIE